MTEAFFVDEGFSDDFTDLELDRGRMFSFERRLWEIGRILRSYVDFFLILNVKAVGSIPTMS